MVRSRRSIGIVLSNGAGKLPGEPRLGDDACRVAEAGDDARFARRHHDDARSGDSCQQDQPRNGDAQLRCVLVLMIVIVIVVIIVVMVCEHQ